MEWASYEPTPKCVACRRDDEPLHPKHNLCHICFVKVREKRKVKSK